MNKNPTLQWYIDHGICIGCRKENAMQGRQKCPACLEKATMLNMKYRSLEYERKRYEKRKQQRVDRIAAGLCPVCGKPAQRGQLCIAHYIKKQWVHEREKEQRRQRGDPRKVRMENGLCYYCSSPAAEGFKVCAYHYDKLMQRKGFGERARKEGEHPWQKDEAARIASLNSLTPRH